MAQQLLTYAGLAQSLEISVEAAKAIAIGLELPRYAGPEGRTLVLCDVGRLRVPKSGSEVFDLETVRRSRGRRAERSDEDGSATPHPDEPRAERDPGGFSDSRAEIIQALWARIEELERHLEHLETDAPAARTRTWWRRASG